MAEFAKRIIRDGRRPLRLDDIPDAYLRVKVLEFIRTVESCRLDTVAEEVFAFAKFGCRARNKETVLSRIWEQVDQLIESGEIEQYQVKQRSRQTHVRLGVLRG